MPCLRAVARQGGARRVSLYGHRIKLIEQPERPISHMQKPAGPPPGTARRMGPCPCRTVTVGVCLAWVDGRGVCVDTVHVYRGDVKTVARVFACDNQLALVNSEKTAAYI
eukprot:5807434-Prymnesium_polylepis.1